MLSFLKEHFPLPKIVIIVAFLVPLGLGLNNYSDILFTDKSPIKRIVNNNLQAVVMKDFIIIEINEEKHRKK